MNWQTRVNIERINAGRQFVNSAPPHICEWCREKIRTVNKTIAHRRKTNKAQYPAGTVAGGWYDIPTDPETGLYILDEASK
jgi:hypothetical protein